MGSMCNASHFLRWTVVGILLTYYYATAFLPASPIGTNKHDSTLRFHPIQSSHLSSSSHRSSPRPSIVINMVVNVEEGEAKEETPDETIVTPVFDFTGGKTSDSSSEEKKAKSLASFDRIDDAIMGGISLSSLKDAGVGKPYASWSGICRIEGGGFCGFRTLPFIESLDTTGQDGLYIDCRLASDDEPQRRVWKMTMRTQANRASEIVYQAEFDLQKEGKKDVVDDKEEWLRVKVPFDSFRLVRGPRLVPDSPKADLSNGICQVGISLSKFVMGETMTALPDFRPGYFDLQVQGIGFFKDPSSTGAITTTAIEGANCDKDNEVLRGKPIVLETVSKDEADKDRPALFKIISPIFKILFSEQSKRRRTATKILTETRGLSRAQTILFGINIRRKGSGLVPAVGKIIGIVAGDAARSIVLNGLKLVLFYPLRLVFRTFRAVKKLLGMKVMPSMTE